MPSGLSCLVSLLFCLTVQCLLVKGQDEALSLEKVTISYQTELSAVAHYIALERGYYRELGLDITMKWYPSGAPQVKEGVEQAAWDMGGAGVYPNIIAGYLGGILNVGISMDQSATNQLVGNAEGSAMWPPESIAGVPIVVSPNSTGLFVVQACLRSQGLDVGQPQYIYEPEQAKCIEAMSPGNDSQPRANLGGLWAPNTYKFLNSVSGAATICTGVSVYKTITGGHMARTEFAEQKPEVVAKVLAGWLRAVEFINDESNQNDVLDYMETFFTQNGVEIPRTSMELDLRLVGLFSLDQQLDLMERRGGDNPPKSYYDIWTNEIAEFMLENGVVSSLANTTSYITDKYMKMINDDEMLRAFAKNRQPAQNSGAMRSIHSKDVSVFVSVFCWWHLLCKLL